MGTGIIWDNAWLGKRINRYKIGYTGKLGKWEKGKRAKWDKTGTALDANIRTGWYEYQCINGLYISAQIGT